MSAGLEGRETSKGCELHNTCITGPQQPKDVLSCKPVERLRPREWRTSTSSVTKREKIKGEENERKRERNEREREREREGGEEETDK